MNNEREELAKLISSRHTMAAVDAILAAGYSKRLVLGYVVVGLTGQIYGGENGFLTRDLAQAAADAENTELGDAAGQPFYRVAEIVEPRA